MKTNIFKYIFIIIVVLLIGLAIYFINIDGGKGTLAIEESSIEINMINEINIGISQYDTINPILSNNRDVQYIDKLIFEPLVDIDKNFKIQNKLANEFSKINDTTYIVKLKEDVYWHDGEKFTGKDVIFTINSLRNSNTYSIYKENVKNIQNIEQIDDYTIKIWLNEKVDFFEYMMCIPIIAKHSYDEKTLESKTAIPIGTGKFKISKIEKEKIVIEKSSIENKSKIERINLILKKTAGDLYNSLRKNDIDLMITENIEYEDYTGSMGYNVKKISGREFDYLILNNSKYLLNDKNVRKAINCAIDKNEINYDVFNNMYNVCDFPLEMGNYLYDSKEENHYDTSKVVKFLVESGWNLRNNVWYKNGRSLRLRLLVNGSNKKRIEVAEKIKEQLEKVNITVYIIKAKESTINYYMRYNNYDMILAGNIISNNPNLKTYFGDNNLSNFYNQEINNITNQINNIENQEENLKNKYEAIREIYLKEQPFISLYFNSLFIITNKSLKGNIDDNWYNIFYNIDNWYKVKDN